MFIGGAAANAGGVGACPKASSDLDVSGINKPGVADVVEVFFVTSVKDILETGSSSDGMAGDGSSIADANIVSFFVASGLSGVSSAGGVA